MKNLIILTATLLLFGAQRADALTVICNGDSNTQAAGLPVEDSWCERLGVQLDIDVINRGVGGTSFVDNNYFFGRIPLRASYYIDYEVEGLDPFYVLTNGQPIVLRRPTFNPLPEFDVAIIAYGTNDINAYRATTPKIIQAIKKLRRKLIASGALVFVATTPKMWEADDSPRYDDEVRRLNKRIRGNWPKKYIEFYEGFTIEDYADQLHLNAQGQQKRAEAAAAALLQ